MVLQTVLVGHHLILNGYGLQGWAKLNFWLVLKTINTFALSLASVVIVMRKEKYRVLVPHLKRQFILADAAF